MKIYLHDYLSAAFPVLAVCHGYSSVFPSVEAAKIYLSGRFGSCVFIDKRSTK